MQNQAGEGCLPRWPVRRPEPAAEGKGDALTGELCGQNKASVASRETYEQGQTLIHSC